MLRVKGLPGGMRSRGVCSGLTKSKDHNDHNKPYGNLLVSKLISKYNFKKFEGNYLP